MVMMVLLLSEVPLETAPSTPSTTAPLVDANTPLPSVLVSLSPWRATTLNASSPWVLVAMVARFSSARPASTYAFLLLQKVFSVQFVTLFKDALNAWAQANSECQIGIEYDPRQNPHVYSSCTCDKLKSHSTGGITVAPYTFDQNNGAIFAADYPTSSPYGMSLLINGCPLLELIVIAVTSVGATQFTWNGNNVASEIGASILTGAIITTGGGFSSFQPQPSYQQAAVSAYLSSGVTLPPSFSYNGQMRAYPDIAFNGHHYQIFYSNNTADQDTCPCVSSFTLLLFFLSLF